MHMFKNVNEIFKKSSYYQMVRNNVNIYHCKLNVKSITEYYII